MNQTTSNMPQRAPDIILVTDEMFTHHPCLSYNIKLLTMVKTVVPPASSVSIVTNVTVKYCSAFAISVHPRRCWRPYISTDGPLSASTMNEGLKLQVTNIFNHNLVIPSTTHLASLLLLPYPTTTITTTTTNLPGC